MANLSRVWFTFRSDQPKQSKGSSPQSISRLAILKSTAMQQAQEALIA
jgi:hypothetical protein